MTIIGAPHFGQSQRSLESLLPDMSCSVGGAEPSSGKQSAKSVARRRLARNPKLRMRMKPRSINAYRKVIDLDPHYARAPTRLGITYSAGGAFEDAIHEFEESQRLSCFDPCLAGLLGHAYALAGNAHKARSLLEELTEQSSRQYVYASSVALIWIGLGKPDQAVEWLARAHQGRFTDMVYAKTEPLLDPVRSNPRFTALLDQMGL